MTKEELREYNKKYREAHKEELREYDKKYYLEHKEECKAKAKKWAKSNSQRARELTSKRTTKYRNTPKGRANHLLSAYNASDKKHNRGEGNLTAEWIIEKIFSQPCAHCGKVGWDVIGCNRINNDLPHTMDNVEPCCKVCNNIEQAKIIKINTRHVFQYDIDGNLIKEWNSAKEAAKELGFYDANIYACCKGKRKTYKGYRWSHEPL